MNSSPKPRIPTEHARHDRLIVTRFAADDAYPTEVAEARELVGTCPECARLADDIRLLMVATSELPAARRPRDFRLSREQAESLHGSFLERLLRPFAAPRLAVLRPVAGAAMSLGLALAVAGAVLPMASPASAPPANQRVMLDSKAGENPAGENPAPAAPGAAQAPAATAAAGVGGAEIETEGQEMARDPIDRAYATDPLTTADGDFSANPTEQPRSLILYAGLVLAAFSLAILLVVTFARRRAYDRLLR